MGSRPASNPALCQPSTSPPPFRPPPLGGDVDGSRIERWRRAELAFAVGGFGWVEAPHRRCPRRLEALRLRSAFAQGDSWRGCAGGSEFRIPTSAFQLLRLSIHQFEKSLFPDSCGRRKHIPHAPLAPNYPPPRGALAVAALAGDGACAFRDGHDWWLRERISASAHGARPHRGHGGGGNLGRLSPRAGDVAAAGYFSGGDGFRWGARCPRRADAGRRDVHCAFGGGAGAHGRFCRQAAALGRGGAGRVLCHFPRARSRHGIASSPRTP